MMLKQNIHTHSVFCDGNDTIEEMVLTALKKGFEVLGFSGHGACAVDDAAMSREGQKEYIKAVLECKEKYKDQIEIYLGLEQDMLGRLEQKAPFSYIIGSKHFMTRNGITISIDYSEEVFQKLLDLYDGDVLFMAKEYYKDIELMAQWEEVDVIGHLDLIAKYNEQETYFAFDDPKYLSLVKHCIDVIAQSGKIIELNTGAIARGYRTTPYPHKTLLAYMAQKKIPICINSDCHNRENLDCGFETCIMLAKEAGFTNVMRLTADGFRPVEL